jgi:ketosteroid isomerase-like protein
VSVERNKAAVRAYFDAVARGDRGALLALFRPELRWRVPKGAIPPYAGLHEGAEKVVELMLGAVSAAFVPGTQRTEIGLLLGEGDVVIAETRLTAKRPGGAPSYDNAYVFVFEFAPDGRIAELREHVDTRTAALVFGGA